MSQPETPSPETLLPHGPPAVLLDEVLAHDGEVTRCRARVLPGNPYLDSGGGVPAAYAVEYMSQCAAVHGALAGGGAGAPPARGFLVALRSLTLKATRFPAGQRLIVEARAVDSTGGPGSPDGPGNAGGAAVFACVLRGEESEAEAQGETETETLAEGRLTVWIPADGEEAP